MYVQANLQKMRFKTLQNYRK